MSSVEKFELTRNRIVLQELISKVEHPSAGAILLFAGTVREWTHGKRTTALSYEGYEPMALKELERIGMGVSAQWPDAKVAITHRLGDLEIGEVSVAIALSAPHRNQAYAASRYAIEELKRAVPIWKRENDENGNEWIEGCHIYETSWLETHYSQEQLHQDWDNRERYAKQIRYTPIGEQGQTRLNEARVAIVGVGALGGAIANQLTRAGVGFIRLIDRDIVEVSNLHRQVLFHERDAALKLPKVVAAKANLEQINSSIHMEAVAKDLTHKNAEELLGDVDLILDGSDNFSTRYLINEVSQKHHIPWVYGAIVGDIGETCTFIPGQGPCFCCLHPEPPAIGLLPTCESAGVIGPIAQLVASYQVAEGLKVLIQDYDRIRKTLLHVEMWNYAHYETKLSAHPACPVCGEKQYAYLQGEQGESVTLLCGRDTVQVSPREPQNLDLVLLAKELSASGKVQLSPYFLRFDQESYQLSIFPDGRVLVHGTPDVSVARGLYAQYLGG